MSSLGKGRQAVIRASAVAAMLATATLPARAADLDSLFDATPPAAMPTQPVEFGTGWYIRGDAGWAIQTQPTLRSDGTFDPNSHSNDFALEIGGGYKFNQWFRTDITYTYYGTQHVNGSGASVNCPSGFRGLYTLNGTTQTPIGVFADGNTCTPHQSASIQRHLLLANGFFDVGTWHGITPYVGAGVGAAYTITNETVNYINDSDGSPYRATLTLPQGYPSTFYSPIGPLQGSPLNPQPHYNYGPQNWDYSLTKTKLSFAFALMAGISYDLTENAKLDIGYRYVNFGSWSGLVSPSGWFFNNPLTTQEIRVGLRYQID